MEVEKKSGRGKKEVSLIGLFGKQFLEEMQNKLAEATGVSFFIIDYKGEPVTKGEKEEKFCKERKKEDEKCQKIFVFNLSYQHQMHTFYESTLDLYFHCL